GAEQQVLLEHLPFFLLVRMKCSEKQLAAGEQRNARLVVIRLAQRDPLALDLVGCQRFPVRDSDDVAYRFLPARQRRQQRNEGAQPARSLAQANPRIARRVDGPQGRLHLAQRQVSSLPSSKPTTKHTSRGPAVGPRGRSSDRGRHIHRGVAWSRRANLPRPALTKRACSPLVCSSLSRAE